MFEKLMSYDVNPNSIVQDSPIICHLIYHNNYDMLTKFVKKYEDKIDYNVADKFGQPAIHHIVRQHKTYQLLIIASHNNNLNYNTWNV